MLLAAQDFQPFDALPNELVAEIFKRGLAASAQEITYGEKTVTRLSLSHVCRRWKAILQSHICIGVPENHHLVLNKDVLQSGYVYLAPVLQRF